MARKPTGKPNGRPPKEIKKAQFETLCKIHCTRDEVCDVLEVCADTLNDWCGRTYGKGETFSTVYKRFAAVGKASLRRMQWNLAEKSAAMAIFLGKNYLGQTDKDDTDVKLTEARTAQIEAGQGSGAVDDETRKQVETIISEFSSAEKSIENK